jgi:GNAT superfamily N-acetyltransferase
MNAPIQYQAERVADIQPELQILAELEYAELGQPFPLLPDWQRLRALEAAGKTLLLTVRSAGALIGANLMLVDTHIHYCSTRVAINDALFLREEYRRGRIGIKLINFAEIALRAQGVQAIFYHAKPLNHLGALLQHLDYAAAETVYRKAVS